MAICFVLGLEVDYFVARAIQVLLSSYIFDGVKVGV
jgi:hypothetical protein